MSKLKYINMNGTLVDWDDATVHVLTPTVKYGALVFEGLRAYWNERDEQLYVLKLHDHLRRFHQTVRVMRFEASWTDEQLSKMVQDTLRANDVRHDVHLRLAAYVDGDGLYDATSPIGILCAAYGRGSGPLEDKTTSAGVSSWRRIGDTAMPPRLKVAANYHNARLGILEAQSNGYGEAIFLTEGGHVAEGAGSCLFVVRDGVAMTPPVTDGILESVTRKAILELLRELGHEPLERSIDRSELYFADEIFFCGTGVEIKPVSAVDGLTVGDGRPGALTRTVWDRYEGIARGFTKSHPDWRFPIH